MSTDSDEYSSSEEADRGTDLLPDDSSSEKPTSIDYMLPSLKSGLSASYSDKIQTASSGLPSPAMPERTGCPNLPNLQVVSFANGIRENDDESVPISMSPNSMSFPVDFNAIFETTTNLFNLKDITTSYGQFSSCQMHPAQLQTIPSMCTNNKDNNSSEGLGVAVSVWNLQGYLESGNDAFFQYFKMPTIQGNYGPHFSSILHADHLDFGFAIFNNVFSGNRKSYEGEVILRPFEPDQVDFDCFINSSVSSKTTALKCRISICLLMGPQQAIKQAVCYMTVTPLIAQ